MLKQGCINLVKMNYNKIIIKSITIHIMYTVQIFGVRIKKIYIYI